jgi:hydrogenase expression/formation protein HypE
VSAGRVELAHGAGGRAMAQLVDDLFRRAFANAWLDADHDQARLQLPAGALAFTTDSFVVSPPFFPGGDIGSLAINGTVNDLAMGGAQPQYLSCALILEEGFALADLGRIAASMARAAAAVGGAVVTGDTKVVPRGQADGIFITTSGIGRIDPAADLDQGRLRPGDRVLVSGTIGDHGVAILSLREGLQFATALESDCAPLNGLVAALLAAAPGAVKYLRDPTRGGVAAALNELCARAGCGMRLEETALPVRDAVRGACELLGLDPLNVANEGKLLAVVDADAADAALAALRAHPLGGDAADIGEVLEDPQRLLRLRTAIGGERVVDWLHGEALPRIC